MATGVKRLRVTCRVSPGSNVDSHAPHLSIQISRCSLRTVMPGVDTPCNTQTTDLSCWQVADPQKALYIVGVKQ